MRREFACCSLCWAPAVYLLEALLNSWVSETKRAGQTRNKVWPPILYFVTDLPCLLSQGVMVVRSSALRKLEVTHGSLGLTPGMYGQIVKFMIMKHQ